MQWFSRSSAPDTDERTKPLPETPGRFPAGRNLKIALRAAKIILAIVIVFALAIGLLLAFTPGAGDAQDRTQQQAITHGEQYPGPPVPDLFARALVATEDHRFYSDPGVDPLAIVRVIGAKVTGKQDQGGSTIAQQLAKMLYTPGSSGWTTVIEQVAIAIKLRATYSPQQILQMYSTVAYYGHGYYGLEQASCGYFGHPPADLTLVQAAMLAGAVNAPTYDDPLTHPAQARTRLEHVLSRMESVGDLTQDQEQQALSENLGLSATRGCR